LRSAICTTTVAYQIRRARVKPICNNLVRERKNFRAKVRIVSISQTLRASKLLLPPGRSNFKKNADSPVLNCQQSTRPNRRHFEGDI